MQLSPHYHREIEVPQKGTILLLGPRMVGKTTLLAGLPHSLSYNLLEPQTEMELRSRPGKLLEDLARLAPRERVFIDEIQRVPELLNVVQIGIDKHRLDFALSGSSARKLKRGRANLLGGRAIVRTLFPLTMKEMGESFDLASVLQLGSLPKIVAEFQVGGFARARDYLDSYAITYIREEIQAEAIVRTLGAFQRFLPIAAESNGQTIVFSNIARESSTPSSTVKEYYQILEDTLLGFFLWPYDRKERKKSRPKFYFFDTGVVRVLQGRLGTPMNPVERGILFETWMINEAVRINEYLGKRLEFSFWREHRHEVDLLISRAGEVLCGVEIKSGRSGLAEATRKKFQVRFPNAPLYIVSPAGESEGEALTYPDFLEWLRRL